MSDLVQRLKELQRRFEKAWLVIDIEKKSAELQELQQKMSVPEFWTNQKQATVISRQASFLEEEIKSWQNFKKELQDISEILQLDIDDKQVNLMDEISAKIEELETIFTKLEMALLLSGKYDKKSALMTIYAGSGGTDAQDWAEMLLRMYLKFCEKQNWKATILNISPGQEAGIKSAQVEILGINAYGYLKAEKGVHRLVRISPFDAEKMRHTSFAMVEILPLLDEDINIDILDKDLRIDTYRAGGHGGQSVNTTDSAVRITHIPTGLVATCQNERSQLQNKESALKVLKSKLQQYYEAELDEEKKSLKGEFTEAAWGNQARSYVLHPYQLVKDHRTDFETNEINDVLDGELIEFIEAFLRKRVVDEIQVQRL